MSNRDTRDTIVGKKVRIKECRAKEHGDHGGCVCNLKDQVVTIGDKFKTPFMGPPIYHIVGSTQVVSIREIEILRDQT